MATKNTGKYYVARTTDGTYELSATGIDFDRDCGFEQYIEMLPSRIGKLLYGSIPSGVVYAVNYKLVKAPK